MKVINGLLKWLALLVIDLSAALTTIILIAEYQNLEIFWLRVIMLVILAFIGGLACRIFFHRLPALLMLVIALVSEVAALLAIDYFYEIDYGLTFLSKRFTFQTPSISDAAQVVLLLVISLPTLFFLRRKKKKAPKVETAAPSYNESPAPKPSRPNFSLKQKIQPILGSLNPANWQLTHTIQKKFKQLSNITKDAATKAKAKVVHITTSNPAPAPATKITRPAPATKIKAPGKKSSKKSSSKASPKLSIAGKKKANQQNDVKLMGEEEHVCPYCLEKVEKDNPKVICPECGTWHHQDCWDLTGTCGVAHRNEL